MIPLAQQASERVPHLFDLADAAYDAIVSDRRVSGG